MKKLLFLIAVFAFVSCQEDIKSDYNAVVIEGTTTDLNASKTVYPSNNIIFATDSNTLKKGDGIHKYADLPFIQSGVKPTAESIGAVKVGGQDHSETLEFGTTNEHGVNLLVGGNPHMIVTGIGNFGFNVGSPPQVPFLVGGGIWTQAGSVWGQMSPYSGSDLTIGTTTNHPVNLQANSSTILALNTDGSLTATGSLNMSAKKITNVADGTEAGDAVSFQQLADKLTATQAAAQANSTATTIDSLVSDFNTLLTNLRAAKIIAQ